MKRTVVVLAMVMMMLSASIGIASAWALDLQATTDPDGDPATGATGWTVFYRANDGVNPPQPILYSDAIMVYYDDSVNDDLAFTSTFGPVWLAMDNPVNGTDVSGLVWNAFACSALNFGDNFMSGAVWINDGDPLWTISSATEQLLSWGQHMSFAVLENSGPTGVGGDLATWSNDGTAGPFDMASNGMLFYNGAPASPSNPSAPAPPIPEIITIVLVALGLAAIGGYVWYRRNNMAAVPA